MKINFFKDILPHLVAIIVFFIISMIFFKPQILENKSLDQHDAFQGRAAGYQISQYKKQTGEEPLWVNSMFSGMPAYLINVHYKDHVFNIIRDILSLGLPNPVSYLYLAFICYYIMLLAFRVRPYLALSGAIIFGLSTFNIISIVAGHNAKLHALAYMPLLIAGIKLTFDDKRFLGFALTALALGLNLRANHLQMTYYLLIITSFYGISELVIAIKDNQLISFLRNAGILVLAAGLGILANTGRIWTVYEYGQHSIRGKSEIKMIDQEENTSGLDKEYAFRYSNGIYEPLVLFIPNILGGSSQQSLDEDSYLGKALKSNGLNRQQISQQLNSVPTYWGNQPLTAPYYGGAIAVFLFALGVAFGENRMKYWLIGLVFFGVILSWGKNFASFNYFLFDYLPGYNKFRSVTFAITLALFSIPLLGLHGLQRFIEIENKKPVIKKFFIAFGATGGFALLIVLIAGIFNYRGAVDAQLGNLPDWFLSALKSDRESLLRSDAFRSFAFVSMVAALIYSYVINKITLHKLAIGLIVLVSLDMILVGKRFLSSDDFKRSPYRQFTTPSDADNYITSLNSDGARVLYLLNPFNEAKPSIHHNSIGGYHGAKIRRYQDVISNCLEPEISAAISGLRAGNNNMNALSMINMLNTKYLIAGNTKESVIINNEAYGHAWFVNSVIKASDPTDELNKTCESTSKSTAVVDQSKFDIKNTTFGNKGTIQLVTKEPNYIVYESKNNEEGLAVFSEIYYPDGWTASIDGNETNIYRANYILRALQIPKGKHKIEFKFRPTSYHVGSTVTIISQVLILLTIIGASFYEIKTSKQLR